MISGGLRDVRVEGVVFEVHPPQKGLKKAKILWRPLIKRLVN